MGTDRLTRVNELLKREIAEAIFQVVNDPDFDLSAVTVTRVATSSSLRQARVFVSIRQEEPARHATLRRLRAHAPEIQERIHRHVVLKYTPHLTFEADDSIAKGDHVLQLLAEMERNEAAAEHDPGEPEAGKGSEPCTDP